MNTKNAAPFARPPRCHERAHVTPRRLIRENEGERTPLGGSPRSHERAYVRPHRVSPACLLAAALLAATPVLAQRGQMENPDFTKGGAIPENSNHDWNLGATGARGWIHSDRLVTSDARQIFVSEVAAGSPADGVLARGDVILGVGGKPFSFDPRVEFGRALTVAESEQGRGVLRVTRWRDGGSGEVQIKLPVLGNYSATAPYGCVKSRRVLELTANSLAKRMDTPDYARGMNPMARAINALGLLAAGNPDHLPMVRREAEWAANFTTEGFQTWYYAYLIMLLAEYQMITGDDAFVKGMRRLALEASRGQSIVGSWGHRFAGQDGRLVGYGMMNAPGVPLTISLLAARQAGLDEPDVDLAIERSARLLRFYIGKGAVPYGDHAPWTQTHEDNGKSGMAAVMFNMLEEPEGAEFFTRMSVASHGSERDTGHTGNFTNILWAMPSVSLAGPHATGAWMREFGAWYFDFARTWDHRFPHQGPPQPRRDSYGGWDATGGYLLAYSAPLKKLLVTGRQPSIATQPDPAGAESLLRDGRGWNNKDRTSAYDGLTTEQLLERLGSWSPTVRERAAEALARRRDNAPVEAIVALLDSPDLHTRLGACEALKNLGGRAAPAVSPLLAQLDHEDLWLRVKAAEALAHIGGPAMETVPVLLKRITEEPGADDPRGMEQRFLSFSVFGRMLRNSLDGVDHDLLFEAVVAGLQNQDGRARSDISNIYKQLSFEEIKPLLPAVLRAVVEPAPSGIMFADGIRIRGLEVLAAHHVEEGMQAAADYIRIQNPWASERRTPQLLAVIESYGAHARAVVPHLRGTAEIFDRGEPNFPGRLSRQKAANIREAIARIEASEEKPELVRIR